MTATKSWGPTPAEKVGREVDSQVAAPLKREHPTGTERTSLTKECGWKDGDRGGLAQTQKISWEEKRKTDLTLTGLLMEGLMPEGEKEDHECQKAESAANGMESSPTAQELFRVRRVRVELVVFEHLVCGKNHNQREGNQSE